MLKKKTKERKLRKAKSGERVKLFVDIKNEEEKRGENALIVEIEEEKLPFIVKDIPSHLKIAVCVNYSFINLFNL